MAEKNKAPLMVRDLSKTYPEFQLQPLSFSLSPGTITGFIGRNGAGKTTTLNSLLGFVRPDGGQVRFWGMDPQENAAAIKQKIGFVSAGMTYYTQKKLRAITRVTRSFYPAWDEQVYRRYMAAFGLSEEKTPAALSNGMKIKYALVLALSHGAEMLILDEPTSGLDPVSREELVEIFLALRQEGKTVLFSTHITSDLEKCADRILFIRRGQLTADSPLSAFISQYRLVECPGDIPPALQALSLGARLTRTGHSVLISRENAGDFADRPAGLDEIMVHLEKEGDTL